MRKPFQYSLRMAEAMDELQKAVLYQYLKDDLALAVFLRGTEQRLAAARECI